MATEAIRTTVDAVTEGSSASVMCIEIDRPQQKNALTQGMYQALADSLESAAQQAHIRAVVLQGSSSVFTSGNDLADFMNGLDTSDPNNPIVRFMMALMDCPKPVVAAVAGHAVGIGTTLLQYCDLVYARYDAQLQMPFAKLALCPEFGASYFLPKIVGHSRAKAWLLTGQRIPAHEAQHAGLVHHVVSDPIAEARVAAQDLASLAPSALMQTKSLLNKDEMTKLKTVIYKEIAVFAEALKGEEFREAATAFFEKRAPQFS